MAMRGTLGTKKQQSCQTSLSSSPWDGAASIVSALGMNKLKGSWAFSK